MAPAPTQALIGKVLDGRFRIDKFLGGGGAGEVFIGEQLSLGRRVAIKVLRSEVASHRELVQRFEREARVLSRLDHPGIVRVLDFGTHDGLPYIVMDYVEGRTFESTLPRGTSVPPLEAVPLLLQLAEALEHAHGHGVIHRDLKPSNVMVCLDQRLKILDFGIARLIAPDETGPTLTQTGLVMGTPRYVSPEQACGEPVDARTDLYALGIIAYRMLVGEVPFDGATPGEILLLHITETPAPVAEKVDLGPRGGALASIIDRLLEKRPADRYPTAGAVAVALQEAGEVLSSGSARASENRAFEIEGSLSSKEDGDVETESLTVMFTEFVGYVDRITNLSYEDQAKLSALHDALLFPVVQGFGGRRIKSIQEATLFTFDSPTRSVRAATALQDRLNRYNSAAPEALRVEIRIGLAMGEVRVSKRDVFGEPVNIAARVKAMANTGEILLAHSVYLAMNRAECSTEPLGQRTLKGIPDPVIIHRVPQCNEEGKLPYGGKALFELNLPSIRPEDANALLMGPLRRFAYKLKQLTSNGRLDLHAQCFKDRIRQILETVRRRMDQRRRIEWIMGGVIVVGSMVGVAVFAMFVGASDPEPAVVREARRMIHAGQAKLALERLESAVAAKKGDPVLHAALAHAFVAVGEPGEALPHFLWVRKKDPDVLEDKDYLADLVLLLELDGDEGKQAEDLVHRMGESTIPALRRRFGDAKASGRIRRKSGEILQMLGEDINLVPVYAELLKSRRCNERKYAIRRFEEMSDRSALEYLHALAQSKRCGAREASKAAEKIQAANKGVNDD